MKIISETWNTVATAQKEVRASASDHLVREIFASSITTAAVPENQLLIANKNREHDSNVLVAQRCLPALTLDFGQNDDSNSSANRSLPESNSIFATPGAGLESCETRPKFARTELLASNQNDWEPESRRPSDFKRIEKLLSGFYLPLGDLNTGIAHIMREHRLGAPINEKKELQGIFNTADEGLIVDLINATLIAPEARRVIYDRSHKVIGYEYQTSVEPNDLGCCTRLQDSSTAVGKVYSFGKLHGDASYVNVVVNPNGVILTAYPTDRKLQSDKRQ